MHFLYFFVKNVFSKPWLTLLTDDKLRPIESFDERVDKIYFHLTPAGISYYSGYDNPLT